MLIKYLPCNLDIDKFLSDAPPNFKYSRDCFVYIMGLITEIPANTKDMLDKSTFVSINASILKSHVHDYRVYLDYLLQHNILETDNHYVVEEKSKGYRFTPAYQTPVQPIEITKFTLVKGLTKEGKWERSMCNKYRELKSWFNQLQFDHGGAELWLKKKYISDVKAGVYGATAKYNANLMNVYRLKDKDYYFRVDVKGLRAHTNLTSLKSELRGWLSWKGKQLVSCDLKCAQPLLLSALLQEAFYEKTSTKDTFTLHKLNPKLYKTIDIDKVKRLICNGQQDINNYMRAVNDDIYLYMQNELTKKGYSVPTRDNAKDIMYSVLYSSNRFFAQPEALPKRLFYELFPSVYNILCCFKRSEPNALAILMQRAESSLMLDRITKRISKEKPDVALFTIHDAILTPDGTQDYCVKVMVEETIRIIGVSPKVEQELLSPLKPDEPKKDSSPDIA